MIPTRTHSIAVINESDGNPESAIIALNRTPSLDDDPKVTARNGTELGNESSQL